MGGCAAGARRGPARAADANRRLEWLGAAALGPLSAQVGSARRGRALAGRAAEARDRRPCARGALPELSPPLRAAAADPRARSVARRSPARGRLAQPLRAAVRSRAAALRALRRRPGVRDPSDPASARRAGKAVRLLRARDAA